MRARLALLVAATTGIVLVVFVVPLGLIVQRFSAERATADAVSRVEGLVVVVGTANRTTLLAAVDQLNATAGTPVTVFLPDGTRLGAAAAVSTAVQLARRGHSVTVSTATGREVAVAVAGATNGTAVVRTFVSDAQLAVGVGRAWLILAVLGAALLLLAVFVADRLARSTIRSFTDVAAVSRLLAAGTLDARVEATGPPEVTAMSTALNHLAGRIQELVRQEREEVADLSHRLRTPLAALRMEVDMLEPGGVPPPTAHRVAERVAGVEHAVTNLIRNARQRREPAAGDSCDATTVVREQIEFWSPLADDEGRRMTVDVVAGPLLVRVPADDLRASVDALLGNVFTHTPAGTPFSVRLERRGSGARLRILDRGPGLADPDAARRGTSGTGSTGLGLDIARRTAYASGGSCRIDSSTHGVRVTLDLGVADDR